MAGAHAHGAQRRGVSRLTADEPAEQLEREQEPGDRNRRREQPERVGLQVDRRLRLRRLVEARCEERDGTDGLQRLDAPFEGVEVAASAFESHPHHVAVRDFLPELPAECRGEVDERLQIRGKGRQLDRRGVDADDAQRQ